MAHANIAIVWGQSNAVGRDGDHTEWVGALPMPFQHSYWLKPTGDPAQTTAVGASESADKVGPANLTPLSLSVGQSLMNEGGTDLVVVSVAQGSTDLARNWADESELSDRLYDYVQAITRSYETWEIIGIYVAQGESDTNAVADANAYEDNMRQKVADLWRDFGEDVAGSIPIVWATIKKDPSASPATTNTINTVNSAITAVANDTPGVHTFDVSDLDQVDTVHFTVPARQEWGVRAVAARVVPNTQPIVSSVRLAVEVRFSTEQYQLYRIEASTNLETWSVIEDRIPGTGGEIVRFFSTDGEPRRYFRASMT